MRTSPKNDIKSLPIWLKMFANEEYVKNDNNSQSLSKVYAKIINYLKEDRSVVVLLDGKPVRLSFDKEENKLTATELNDVKYEI